MKLKDLVKDIQTSYYRYGNIDILSVTNDSRKSAKGSLFIAISGYKDEGIKYIDDAIKKGTIAIVADKKYKGKIKQIISISYFYVDDPRYANLLIARRFYNNPSKEISLIGITGTNGKTTITYIIEDMLSRSGIKVGVIGTVSYRYGNKVLKASNTTPDAIEIQSMLREMKNNSVTHVAMEVSSHSLVMKRVMPEDYKYAVFTNLSQDHLDFHKDMESYFEAKSILFKHMAKGSKAVLNADDAYGRRLIDVTGENTITYGIKNEADIRGEIISLTVDKTRFRINGREYLTNLVGIHNIYNILASFAIGKEIGINEEILRKSIETISSIPGRFERVFNNKGYSVFVDYAHTPDALDHLLDAANNFRKGRIITVFGCGGDRDRGKRPLMGRVVEEKSDIAIITSDNPRTEDAFKIIEEIKSGLKMNNHIIIPDRREAIYRAIKIARDNDIVLIAGKGHEDYQILNDRTIHFDDREVAKEAIRDVG